MQSVPYTHEDRQWDARFNVPTDEYLEELLSNIRTLNDQGKFKYILVSGIEIGTRPTQNDYKCRHVHLAIILHNRMSKSSILRNFGIVEGYGYYLVPRDRKLPYSGWRAHHIKPFSKVDESKTVLFESGSLPLNAVEKTVKTGEEEKKRKLDSILLEMREDLENGREEECFRKFPRNYLMYGEKIKAMLCQKRDFFKDGRKSHPHIWLYGYPGTGKTSILQYIYPKNYKKNLYNKFFDLYDPKEHTHIILEDLDHEAVERLSINFLKTICDPQGFAVDQKYKTPQLTATNVLVTSNFDIGSIMPDEKGVEENKAAMLRRFWHVRIDSLLRLLQLKIIPKWDQKKLKFEGNTDPGKLFVTWDYLQDVPLCQPIQSPEYYQELIRKYYYGYLPNTSTK